MKRFVMVLGLCIAMVLIVTLVVAWLAPMHYGR